MQRINLLPLPPSNSIRISHESGDLYDSYCEAHSGISVQRAGDRYKTCANFDFHHRVTLERLHLLTREDLSVYMCIHVTCVGVCVHIIIRMYICMK